MQIKIFQTPEGKQWPLPSYATDGSSGLDLIAALLQKETLDPGQIKLIPTGIHVEMPKGLEIQIRPRSGLALKHGITVLNAPGTIDSDYRGEIKVILINHSKNPFVIEPGTKIAQMVFAQVQMITWEEVNKLNISDRQEGGFGSTGLKVAN